MRRNQHETDGVAKPRQRQRQQNSVMWKFMQKIPKFSLIKFYPKLTHPHPHAVSLTSLCVCVWVLSQKHWQSKRESGRGRASEWERGKQKFHKINSLIIETATTWECASVCVLHVCVWVLHFGRIFYGCRVIWQNETESKHLTNHPNESTHGTSITLPLPPLSLHHSKNHRLLPPTLSKLPAFLGWMQPGKESGKFKINM